MTDLDLIRNFILFDAGQKKVPRPHQFFGVKAAQERRDTRAEHRAKGEAYRVTHAILAQPKDARNKRLQETSQQIERMMAQTVPVAARTGNLFTRALARLWGRT